MNYKKVTQIERCDKDREQLFISEQYLSKKEDNAS